MIKFIRKIFCLNRNDISDCDHFLKIIEITPMIIENNFVHPAEHGWVCKLCGKSLLEVHIEELIKLYKREQ